MTSCISEVVCVSCGNAAPHTGREMTCPECGPDEGILEICFDLDRVRAAWRAEPLTSRPLNLWRYRELLPLDASAIPQSWPVGGTPVLDLARLARELGVAQFLVKDDGRNPTASLKDRASAVGVVHALERGATTIAAASTGNAATSLAGHAALAGIRAMIFVPKDTSAPKLAQSLCFNASVFAVDGNYDEAYQLCSAACERFGWYNRNSAINPVLVEGKKTCGLEIAEQCATRGGVPDWVAVGVGDGCTIAGIAKGFAEMHALGIIDHIPRMLGVQAATVAPLAYAFEHDEHPPENSGNTIAHGINVNVPSNWRKATNAVHNSEGNFVTVTDDQMLVAIAQLGRHGIFAEPAAAASLAGINVALQRGIISPHDRVLAVVTGSGLKDTASALKAAAAPIQIEPTLDAVAAALESSARP
jgi:threonine synthase